MSLKGIATGPKLIFVKNSKSTASDKNEKRAICFEGCCKLFQLLKKIQLMIRQQIGMKDFYEIFNHQIRTVRRKFKIYDATRFPLFAAVRINLPVYKCGKLLIMRIVGCHFVKRSVLPRTNPNLRVL